jgi:hypothetical protein
MRSRLLPALACGLALAAAWPGEARPATIAAGSPGTFAAAVQKLRASGGTIVLQPGRYDELVVGPRGRRQLTIRAQAGVTIRHLRLEGTRNVRLVGLRIVSTTSPAHLDINRSAGITLDRVRIRGRTLVKATLRLKDSRRVTIRRSDFSHCGQLTTCLLAGRSHGLHLLGNHFHDCRGCDFVRGRFGTKMVIRGNRFDRALIGPCGRDPNRCNHQDLIEIQGGTGLLVERNRFGLYQIPGGGQLYLLARTRNVVVRNNLFLATDPRVPGVQSHVAINLGGERYVPRNVVIKHNTILSGKARPAKGVNGSIRLVPRYAGVPLSERPIVANNVIRLARAPELLCRWVQLMERNVILDGDGCSPSDVVGDPRLDRLGRPTADSLLTIDGADPRWRTRFDFHGRPRDPLPDIGAYEYLGPR